MRKCILALATLAAPAQADETPNVKTSERNTIVVTANRDIRHEASSGTKTNTPLIETPMSVQVVPRTVLDDLQVISLKDSIRNVSGVMSADYSFYDFVQIRGFANGYAANFRNGLQLQAITGLEMALVDRIEVVKGPASMLYGRIEPGGLVNMVTKRPEEKFAWSAQQQIGSYGLLRGSADVTGKLNDSGTLLFRVIGAYTRAKSHLDFVRRSNLVGAAHVTWRPTSRFELRINVEKQVHRFMDTEDQGIPIIGDRAAHVPRHSYYGDPVNWKIPNRQNRTLIAFDWTWALGDRWKLTQRFHIDRRNEQQLTLWFGGFDGIETMDRGLWYVQPRRKTIATNLDLTGDVELAGMRHRLLIGFDWFKFTSRWHGYSDFAPGVVPPINIYNPSYGISPAAIRALPENFFYVDEDRWTGVYIQDQISLNDRIELLVGGRYDWAANGNSFNPNSLGEARAALRTSPDTALSPRIGLLYRLRPNISLYASYTSSFGTNNGRTASGDHIPPQMGKQVEIGVKASLADDAVSLTASVFDLRKSNVLTPDLSTPDPDDSKAIGEVRNRGFEFDLSGQLTRHLSAIATYTYSDAKIVRDNGGNKGNRLHNVPRHAASLWAKYDTAPAAEHGLVAGAGLYLVGKRQGDDANSWQLPGYARVDAMLGWRTRLGPVPAMFQVNVQNLFDKTYIDRGSSTAKYGAPRTVIGSLRIGL